MKRRHYPGGVTDEEWALVAPYLTLMAEDAPRRSYSLREVFSALRWIVRAGSPWRMMPNDLPLWEVVYQQTQRWLRAGIFEALVHDMRELLRLAAGRDARPSASVRFSAEAAPSRVYKRSHSLCLSPHDPTCTSCGYPSRRCRL